MPLAQPGGACGFQRKLSVFLLVEKSSGHWRCICFCKEGSGSPTKPGDKIEMGPECKNDSWKK